MEYLLCARYYSKHLGYASEQEKQDLCFHGTHTLVRGQG